MFYQINSDLSREYSSLTVNTGTGSIVFNRFGKLVIITIYWTGPVTQTSGVIASVPLNARPYFDIRTPVYTALTNIVTSAFINTNGEIYIQANGQTPTQFSDFFSAQIVYMLQ